MLFSDFQNYFPFSLFLVHSSLSKLPVKIWVDESYIEELYVIPIKFRNKLPSFHYRKIAIAQNYERKTNLIQRAYVLT